MSNGDLTNRQLPAAQIDSTRFRGWDAISLSNGFVSLTAVPDVGGRVSSLRLGPHEYLFLNERNAGRLFTPAENVGDGTGRAWKNYGGDKTWPAPQGWSGPDEWPGPPDGVIDSGRYHAETFAGTDAGAVGAVAVAMTSPDDPYTGLRVTRRLTLRPGSARVSLQITFANVSDRTVRWAIWDVTQLDCSTVRPDGTRAANPGCWLFVPTDPTRPPAERYRVMFGENYPQTYVAIADDLLGVHHQSTVGKIGVPSPAGWIAFADQMNGYSFCERFAVQRGADYPDGGSTVACWTEAPAPELPGLDFSPSFFLLEAEILGPLTTLRPGETTSLEIEWCLARTAGGITRVAAAGAVHEPLAVSVAGGWTAVRGAYGVFDEGELLLSWKDAAGREVARVPLGPVSPLALVRLDAVLPLPADAAAAALVVRRADGGLLALDSTLAAGER